MGKSRGGNGLEMSFSRGLSNVWQRVKDGAEGVYRVPVNNQEVCGRRLWTAPNLSLSEYYEKMQLLNSKKTTQLCI